VCLHTRTQPADTMPKFWRSLIEKPALTGFFGAVRAEFRLLQTTL